MKSKSKIKICHITSVHPRHDVRIFFKECISLAEIYEVSLIVADGKGDTIKNNIKIYDVGKNQGGRINRFTKTVNKVYKKALSLDCDIYHFHDPELIFAGLKLKKKNKIVIYDVHEDVPLQILAKPYLNKFIKPILSKVFNFFEKLNAKKFNYIITATPIIRDKFKIYCANVIDINNYPIIENIELSPYKERLNEICYVGGISNIRGFPQIIDCLSYLDVTLNLAGDFESQELEKTLKAKKEWEKVNFLGYVDRTQIKKILLQSKIGLVTLYPTLNYIESLPVKMFEYMYFGLPIIASNFPYWEKIINSENCGICVNPLDPKEIADAINTLLNNENLAETMGNNGRQAVINKYNWEIEKNKLFAVYNSLLFEKL